MKLYDIHRENLLALIGMHAHGSKRQFAEILGVKPSMISTCIRRSYRIQEITKLIERKFNLPVAWMEIPNYSDPITYREYLDRQDVRFGRKELVEVEETDTV